MLETDAGSRRHLLFIVGFLACLFGGFALWGTVERAVQHGRFGGLGIGDPAPVEPDRAVFLAERRKAFQARKQMASYGKLNKWQKAIQVADTYLARNEDTTIRMLRGEALVRLSRAEGGIAIAKILQNDDSLGAGEADLLRGETRNYDNETQRAINNKDENKAAPLDANNTAWLAAITPSISEPEILAKAVSLSEKAVQAARYGKDPVTLATYTNTLGGLYYRSQRDEDAVRILLESENLRSDPFNAAFLVLAYDRTGDKKAAKIWCDRLQAYLSNTYATRDGQLYRHQLLLLWREIANKTQELPSTKTNR